MKKLLILTILSVFCFGTINAQNQNSQQIVVDVNDLTPDQLEKIKAKKELEGITEKIQTYGEWAGMGKEVGTAVREGLFAVKDVTVDFADTDVGRVTMGLIIWKVIGDDLKGVVFGIPLWLLGAIILIWSYRRYCMDRKVLIKREGGWWIFGGVREYEVVRKHDSEGIAAVIHAIIFIAFTWAMFGAAIF